MKSSPVYSPFTALALKTVGLIMIVSFILDMIIGPMPYNPVQRSWQLGLTNQLVERGILPMIGIALLLVGYWIENNGRDSASEPKSIVQDLRFWAFLLSTLLGLIFLLLVPLHFNNVRLQSNEALSQINQKAEQAESQLQTQTKQVDALIKDPQKLTEQLSQLDKAIANGQVPPERLTQAQTLRQLLGTFKQNPKALNQQVEAVQTQIRSRKLEAENQAKTEALKLGLRTGLSSLLLSIGYIVIGWTGLRGLGDSTISRRSL